MANALRLLPPAGLANWQQSGQLVTIQFQCPQGHLLEADESQAHEQICCPQCGLLFVIPGPNAASSPPSTFDQLAAEALARSAVDLGRAKTLHIPCPNGHLLDAPIEMLGQDVLCPHCEVQFRLLEMNSLEYRERQTAAREHAEAIEDYAVGEVWLKWAIAVSLFVALALLILFLLSG